VSCSNIININAKIPTHSKNEKEKKKNQKSQLENFGVK